MKNTVKAIVLTKSGKVSTNVVNMLRNCNFYHEGKVYTGYYSGSGRFTSAHSALTLVKQLLDAGGYKYTVANDAKFGGIKGEHVVLSKVAKKFLEDLKNSK